VKKIALGFGLLAVLLSYASGQEEEEERVANAGTVPGPAARKSASGSR
jgi:hypothetical protein